MRIVHTKVVVPSRLGMSLYMSAFEDLMSMKTRAFLVKDIDPAILQRLLGTRSLATELSSEQLENYYSDKAPVPTNAKELQRLMSHGGGLDRQFNNPLYKEKLNNIPHETIRGWVEELCQAGSVTKLDGTGQDELDGKWFTPYMAEIHGTLGCLAVAGGKEVENLLELHTRGLTYKTATTFDGTKPVAWEERDLGDPQEALRVKIIEMLGSEGPKTSEEMVDRLPFPQPLIERALHELEGRNVISVGFYLQTNDAEYILKIDEHRLTGGQEEVVEYRWIQNMVLDKSFHNYDDSFTAFNEHVLFQKQQELLYRVDQFAFNDWTDVQLDSDVVMGRLLHNRIGYTTKRNIAMLLGLKPEPWIGPMEEEILTKIPPGENVTRQEIMEGYPKEMNIERFNATSRMPLQILSDKCWSSSSSRKFLAAAAACPCSIGCRMFTTRFHSKMHWKKWCVAWGLSRQAHFVSMSRVF